MKCIAVIASLTWAGLWFTPDQQGRRLFEKGEFEAAAKSFQDPMWQGSAFFRAGDFKQAAQSFARRDTPEGHYNLGNTWVMLGKYENAVAEYEKALKKRPDWKHAVENRDLAAARAKLLEQKGGDMGDQKIGADEIKFDKKKNNNDEGQETEVTGAQKMSDKEIQAMWLRRVQTKPADFLKSKFAYQHTFREDSPDDE